MTFNKDFDEMNLAEARQALHLMLRYKTLQIFLWGFSTPDVCETIRLLRERCSILLNEKSI